MGKTIITGAGGFVGGALAKKLIENGNEVVAISNAYNNSFPNNPLIKRIEAEIYAPEKLKALIPRGDYDAFYHLAWRGVNGREKADSIVQVENIRMAITCAIVAKDIGCRKYLCAGTIAERAVESMPVLDKTNGGMAYSVAKYCAHQMVENYCKTVGLNFVWMQFSNIYGPQNKTGNLVSYTLEQLRSGREAIFGPALQPYDFIYVDDIIEAVYRLGKSKTNHNFYFIGSGYPKVLKDYLAIIGEKYGRPNLIKVGVRPDDGIKYTGDMFDISKLVEDIGVYVSASFEEHIKYTIENY